MVRYCFSDIRPMVVAIREGNIEAVKQHLADGADVNAKDESLSLIHI